MATSPLLGWRVGLRLGCPTTGVWLAVGVKLGAVVGARPGVGARPLRLGLRYPILLRGPPELPSLDRALLEVLRNGGRLPVVDRRRLLAVVRRRLLVLGVLLLGRPLVALAVVTLHYIWS